MVTKRAKRRPVEKKREVQANVDFSDMTGSESTPFSEHLLKQVICSLYLPDSLGRKVQDKRIHAAMAALREIAPQGGVEGMLAVQMVATHDAAMESLRRAAIPAQTFEGRRMALAYAQKMMRLYLDQVKVLNKQRGRSDQKVVIEHVNVEAGGQAIVGQVEHTVRHQEK